MKHSLALSSVAVLLTGVAAFGLDACNAPTSAQSATAAAPTAVSDSAPPPLPVYTQPPIPAPGYIWTPGYWAWDDSATDYYWTPGTWVEPPRTGLLWTPGYWAYLNGRYDFYQGYWGSQVGFYGGIDYGYGYGGDGYQGGRWQGDDFYYNTTVNNVANRSIANVYSQGAVERPTSTRASFNGGGGVSARPSSADLAAVQAQHVAPTSVQGQHEQLARTTPALRASLNNGHPAIAATSRPAVFEGQGVVADARAPTPGRPATAAEGPTSQIRTAAVAERPASPAFARPATQPDQRPSAPAMHAMAGQAPAASRAPAQHAAPAPAEAPKPDDQRPH